jgi:hypothetical protein
MAVDREVLESKESVDLWKRGRSNAELFRFVKIF